MTQWGLDTLFNPAKRHLDEEKRRLQSTREEVGDSSGGKRIDLESGKVVIRKEGADEDAATTEDAQADDSADTKSGEKPAAKSGEKPDAKPAAKSGEKPSTTPTPKSAPSPAAVRAAQRRGRQPR